MNVESKNLFKQQFKKRCFRFSLEILALAQILKDNKIYWSLIDQLVRPATSIGANVVEGGNSTSRREFINYFQISLKSASETLYWLALIQETHIDQKEKTALLINECTEIKKIITTIIMNTKENSKILK